MPPYLYQRVEQAVNAYDPMAFLAGCAPANEYDIEIQEIFELIVVHDVEWTKYHTTRLEQTTLIVKFVFEIYFHEGCISRRVAEEVAQKIIDPSIQVAQPRHHVIWYDDQP